ncbi:histidine kinase [Pseudonocardia nematodicida]|uniref:histidine kinase n=1 Tax=Pseudonocardia nematodicida TaxID=1206997 RepID=A0ABV1KEM4_9PSEU
MNGSWTWHPRATDVLMIAIAAGIGLSGLRISAADWGTLPSWLVPLDAVLGVAGALSLWWRRRFPVLIASGLAVLAFGFESVHVASTLALFTVAIHCSIRATAVLTTANLLAYLVFYTLRPVPDENLLFLVGFLLTLHVAVVAWGLAIRSRRELVASLRERATMAEREARLRAERSQHEARETLAREMHDVLGHRLSLLSVHAGALTYHRNATAEETSQAAEVIRDNAHRALQDLREVIGVLRAPVGELPLPGVVDVAELIDEAGQAGTPVEIDDEHGVLTGRHAVPETAGRTLYRFVQEGLTNARKHAPGAPVSVRITGDPGEILLAEVENAPPSGPVDPATLPPGSGEGLRGLAERATLVGGRLDHGPTAAGGWKVGMRLPWPA